MTNENALANYSIPEDNSKKFTREQAQAINSLIISFNLIDKINNFHCTDLKMEKKFTHYYHLWGDNKKVMDINNKRKKSLETFWLIERRQETTKSGNFRFKADSKFNRKVWVPGRLDKGGRNEETAIDWELLLKNFEKKQWGKGYFDFNKPRASSSTDPKELQPQKCIEHRGEQRDESIGKVSHC